MRTSGATKIGALLFLAASCRQPCYPETQLSNFTSYSDGINESDLVGIHDQLQQVEACVAPLRTQWLSDQENKDAECIGRGGAALVLRACLRISVAPDWYLSSCSGEQIFPCTVGPQRCLEKGLTPDPKCPCSCRAQIQDMTTIWVTPNKKLLSAYAVTLLTGCLSPWTPTLAPCSNIQPE